VAWSRTSLHEYVPVMEKMNMPPPSLATHEFTPPPGLADDEFIPQSLRNCLVMSGAWTMTEPSPIFDSTGEAFKAAAAFTPVQASQYLTWPDMSQSFCHQHALQWQTEEKIWWQDHRFAPRRKKRHSPLLLGTHLKELDKEDPQQILIVRKISRLGFQSAERLKKYFERFGPISKVLLSNSHAKESGSSGIRLRPSGIGFVVFEDSADAEKALAEGEDHTVNDVEICLRAFERRRGDSTTTASDGESSPCGVHDVGCRMEELMTEDATCYSELTWVGQ